MANKTFSTREIAAFKRIARNAWPEKAKLIKIDEKIANLVAEKALLEEQIALKEAYVVKTTGYSVFDLMERKITNTPVFNEDGSPKLDEKGKQVINTQTDYVPKYPETIIPVAEVTAEITTVEGPSTEVNTATVETEEVNFDPTENTDFPIE